MREAVTHVGGRTTNISYTSLALVWVTTRPNTSQPDFQRLWPRDHAG
jgi:hypothetical protein